MQQDEQYKIISGVATALICAGLALLMLNVYLERVVPQEEAGVVVAMGVDTEGGDDLFEPTPASEVAQELAAVSPSDASVGEEELQTQDLEESVSMPEESKKKSQEEIRRERERQEKLRQEKLRKEEEKRRLAEEQRKREEEQRRADEIRKSVAQGFGSGAGGGGTDPNATGMGGGSSSGSKGSVNGTQGAANQQSGSGHGWSLSGRGIIGTLVSPSYSAQEEGKVVVKITVDVNGNVIDAVRAPGTNIDNPKLINDAIAAAKKNKFTKSEVGLSKQEGYITYKFKLQ